MTDNRQVQDPKVSIVMPSLNVAPFIRESIESVLNQTLRNIEVICVDAGSTDGTREILEEYAGKDGRVRLLHSDYKSYGYQMNMGMDAARGEYFAIVETDDCIDSRMYEDLTAIADEQNAEIVKSDFYYFLGNGTKRKYYKYGKIVADQAYYGHLLDSSVDKTKLFSVLSLYNWTGIYRLDFLRSHRIRHNETKGASYQDNGFRFLTFTYANRTYFTDKPYYMYRQDNPNSSMKSKEKIFCLCDENDYIRNRLDEDPDLDPVYIRLSAWQRYHNYNTCLDRIADVYKKDFLERYRADLIQLKEAGELDSPLFTHEDLKQINKIIENPESFLRDYYFDRPEKEYLRIDHDSLSDLQICCGRLEQKNIELTKSNMILRRTIAHVYQSRSYRLGNRVMDPIKKLSDHLKRKK